MKKFVTGFCLLLLCSTSVWSQSQRTVLYPAPVAEEQKSVYMTPPKYLAPLAPLSPQAETALFFMDTLTGQYVYTALPFRLNYTDQATGDPLTDTMVGVAQRYTSPYTRTYLDSIQVIVNVVKASSIPDNHFSLGVYGQTLNSGGVPFPSGAPKDTAITDELMNFELETPLIVTIPFNHKNVGKNFFITMSTPYNYDDEIGGEDQNFYGIWSDSLDFDGSANIDINLQRGYLLGLNSTWVNILSRDQGQTNFYSNYWMMAFVTDQVAEVAGEQLSGNALGVNYPNPVSESTEIPFSLAERTFTSVKVYNQLGNLVATPFEGYKDAGTFTAKFNADNLSNGTYYYTITAGKFTASKSMIVAK